MKFDVLGTGPAGQGVAARVIEQFGWEAADMGTAAAARAIEPRCQPWCIPGFLENRWSHALTLLGG